MAARCTYKFDSEDPCLAQWLDEGTGPYGEAASPFAMRYRTSASDNEHPDIYFYGSPRFAFRGIYPGLNEDVNSPSTFSWSVVQMPGPGADGRGTVMLRSTDPRDMPLIHFNFLEGEGGERDLDAMVEGAELVLRIFNATDGSGAPFTRVHPDPALDLRQSLKDEMFAHHASSTCRMSHERDPDRCIGPDFRVQSVHHLRVVDTSVFPRTPGAWPAVPTYMMGLKLADLLAKEAAGSTCS